MAALRYLPRRIINSQAPRYEANQHSLKTNPWQPFKDRPSGGIVGTIFGAMNQIEIIKINEHIKQGDQERKLLVDITKINSASIDKLEKTVEQVLLQLKELALYDVPLIEVHLAHNLRSLIDE